MTRLMNPSTPVPPAPAQCLPRPPKPKFPRHAFNSYDLFDKSTCEVFKWFHKSRFPHGFVDNSINFLTKRS